MRNFIILFICYCFFYFPSAAQEKKSPFSFGQIRKDETGKVINAHGAGLLYFGDTYYMFGEIKSGRTRLVPGQNWEDYRVPAGGISCYSSRDLVSWKYMGVALAPVTGDSANDLDTSRVMERPKVIYNGRTKKFVMWMHVDREDYSYARSGVAVSDRPEGPYTFLGSIRPNGQMSRDMTLFQDDDGKGYLIYASEDNNTMQICLLSEDYLSPTKNYRRILVDQRREAPALFKQDGRYYLITSLCSGWSPNPALYSVADSLMGNWKNIGNPCLGPDAETTFQSQSTYVLPLKGKTGEYIFLADRWNKTDLPESRYIWLPLQIRNGRVEIKMAEPVNGQIILDSLTVSPFSIIQYQLKIKCRDTSTKGYSFIRFFDSANHSLLSYQSATISKTEFQETGYYTEAPPFTKYALIGVESDLWNPGIIDTANYSVETNIGKKDENETPICNLDDYMKPFWNSDTIFNETVLLYSSNGGPAEGRLLFKPSRIISVRSFDLSKLFKKGPDYTINGNTITRSNHSSMPFRADTSFDRKQDLSWYDLKSQWVVITYTHQDKWTGPKPSFKGDHLPRLIARLKGKQPVKIMGYGMSITRGQDVSGYIHVAPYMPTYLDLLAGQLRKNYHYHEIEMINAGLPGALVSWGAEYADKYINPVKPDLVIVDFGMNDFWRYTPEEFKRFIQKIIDKVKTENPEAEFLLISNMDFDPDYILDSDKNKSFYISNMQGYEKVLLGFETKGTVNLDMTTLSDAIYSHKKPKDCIANPLHPNDYMARWYAQSLAAMLWP